MTSVSSGSSVANLRTCMKIFLLAGYETANEKFRYSTNAGYLLDRMLALHHSSFSVSVARVTVAQYQYTGYHERRSVTCSLRSGRKE